MSKSRDASPFQALEQQACHAFREWPLWLALRTRELAAHLDADRSPPRSPAAESHDETTAGQRGHPPLDQRGVKT
jgi:hypothetical protein